MTRNWGLTVLAALGLGACATPGIDYEAKLMARYPEAAAQRDVIVDYFSGPMGGWYTERFEAMLANATLDGRPWFRFADYAVDVPAGAVGIYSGYVDVVDHRVHEYTRTVSKCVEWDGLFDCETRADVEEYCIEETVEVVAHPRLINRASGEVVYEATYGGEASREECEEGHYHYGAYGHHGPFGFDAPADLIRSALSETLHPIRLDVAPRNAIVRAEFVTEALDPMVRVDPAFQQGVEAVKRDPFTSCSVWLAMSEEYPAAPAVIHNMGACAEASSDFLTAQSHYARAAELSSALGATDKLMQPYLASLQRLSGQRWGLEQIKQATGDAQPVPEAPALQDEMAEPPVS
ncbi:MAG: hypothetical protein AAGA24_02440 [Pseudomonadota bacterium]